VTIWNQIVHDGTNVLDVLSIMVILATLTQYLPPIASALSIIWLGIRIAETCTVREWVAKIKKRHFSRADCLMKGGQHD